jgi:hypothetical protein
MNALDENTDFIDQADVAAMPIALRYGGIAALVFIIVQLLLDTLGIIDYASGTGIYYPSILAGIASIVLLYMAIKHHRDEELGGYITFGRCVKIGFLFALFSGIFFGVFGAVYHSFIRPDIIPSIMEFQRETWEAQGLNDDQIEQAASMTKMFMSPVAMAVMGIINFIIMDVIISLILGGILKKNPPMYV